jgi:hypothetical protein
MNQFQEFGSVILTVDHTSTIPGPHSVQKMVFSTETLVEATLAVLKYYGEEALLASADTIAQFQGLAQTELPALVYRTPENVQIVLDYATFSALVERSETMLDASTFILNTVGELIVTAEQAAGGVVPILVLSWAEGEVAPIEEPTRPVTPAKRTRKTPTK